MDLFIHRDQQLKRLQAQFQSAYPYLWLAFYARPEQVHAGSFRRHELPGHLRVGDIRSRGMEGVVPVGPNVKTGELERLLYQSFGLPAQVFRKSYGRWMPTWATDAWPLRQQNHYGQLMGERGVKLSAQPSSSLQSVRS